MTAEATTIAGLACEVTRRALYGSRRGAAYVVRCGAIEFTVECKGEIAATLLRRLRGLTMLPPPEVRAQRDGSILVAWAETENEGTFCLVWRRIRDGRPCGSTIAPLRAGAPGDHDRPRATLTVESGPAQVRAALTAEADYERDRYDECTVPIEAAP